MPDPRPLHLALVGATGAVGQEMLAILAERNFPIASLRLFASPRSLGQSATFRNEKIPYRTLTPDAFQGLDLALFSAGASISRAWSPIARAAGAVVIDNSSAFRADPACPLVIPEVNGDELATASPAHPAIVSVPNCSAIILLMALTPLQRAFGIDRIVASTYQAVSGAGARAIDELRTQTAAALAGTPLTRAVFPEPCAFNLFSHNAPVDPISGLNGEEAKVISETRRIWRDPAVRISITCIRVPVIRAHSIAINVTLATPATLDQVRTTLAAAPGLSLLDDRAANAFPTPLKAQGQDAILVGRLREDPSQLPARFAPGAPTLAFDLFISGDQLRKGAALNAVQIAEAVFQQR
ncbi:aspartate-semialdehyde dehydrogenase [soil metagenome]